jgi:hypothetical protein
LCVDSTDPFSNFSKLQAQSEVVRLEMDKGDDYERFEPSGARVGDR